MQPHATRFNAFVAVFICSVILNIYYHSQLYSSADPRESRTGTHHRISANNHTFSSDASTHSTLRARASASEAEHATDPWFKNTPMAEYSPSFTTHFCTGGASPEIFGASNTFQELEWNSRKCLFRNLVWNGSAFRYYFNDRSRYASTWDYERGSGDPLVGDQIDTKHLKVLFSNFSGHGNTAIEFVRGPIPKSIQSAISALKAHSIAPEDRHEDQVAFVWATTSFKTTSNIGHVLGDFIWPIFETMLSLQMLSPGNRILFNDVIPSPYGLPDGIPGHKFLSAFNRGGHVDVLSDMGIVKFPLFVAGRGKTLYKQSPFYSAFSAKLLRDFCVRNARSALLRSMPAPAPPGKESQHAPSYHDCSIKGKKIGIRLKSHRHRILNVDKTVARLKNRFPGVEVVAFDPKSLNITGGGNKTEISFMNSADVFITPAGGGSFGALYMKDGASVIVLNVCWPGSAEAANSSNAINDYASLGTHTHCVRVENFLWDVVPHIHKLTYSPRLCLAARTYARKLRSR